MTAWEPQKGDAAIELRHSDKSYESDRISTPVTIKTITTTMVITSDGERYNRNTLKPISEGRYSARTLVPVTDPRVLCVEGRSVLRDLAQLAENLASLPRTDPTDYAGAIARIITAAGLARATFVEMLAAATRAEQESQR